MFALRFTRIHGVSRGTSSIHSAIQHLIFQPFSQQSSSGRGSSGANPLPRDLLDQISQLDISTTSSGGKIASATTATSATTRQKLQRPLEAPEKKRLSAAQRGALEATAEDLQDVLTEIMSSPAFANLFKGTEDPAAAVYIHQVKLNSDYSHATIIWKSDILQVFMRKVLQKMGEESLHKLIRRSTHYVNSKLQSKESYLRSQVIRHMHFRRVPRLFFKPWDAHLGAYTEKQKQQRNNSGDGELLLQHEVQRQQQLDKDQELMDLQNKYVNNENSLKIKD